MELEDFDWAEMWNNAIEGSRWGQRAGMPEFWDDRVDWFEELVQQSDRADYIYLYNILYQLGIYANVEIIDANHNMRFPDLDAAVQHYKTWMSVSGADEERLRLYLSENLVKENDAFWLRHTLRTAMISWRKDVAKV